MPDSETNKQKQSAKWCTYMTPSVVDSVRSLEKLAYQSGGTVYPPQKDLFRALRLTTPNNVKVVIIGQDPYHEDGQANGLAFSVNPGVRIPPSLQNIYKEIASDLGVAAPVDGDLSFLAEQGVLLLNSCLTVSAGEAASHSEKIGWEAVTSDIVRVCAKMDRPIVFLLWGAHAKRVFEQSGASELLDKKKLVLVSSHPSPLAASRGSAAFPAFLGSKPFSHVNSFLEDMGESPIVWSNS